MPDTSEHEELASAGPTPRTKPKKPGGSSGSGFQSMGLSGPVFRGVMKRGYRVPTPIQRRCIPVVTAGHDCVAMARTGSGKTAAFLIPLLERLGEHSAVYGARAVILSPTREIALQTSKFARELGKFTSLRHCLLLGGDSMTGQFDALAANPDIIIATPGRLVHVAKTAELSLANVEVAVFDEADRLFEMGFAPQLRYILSLLPEARQTLLFSATMPAVLADFAQAGLRHPHVLRLDADSKISPRLDHRCVCVRPDQKYGALLYLLRHVVPRDSPTLVFVCTRHHVELVQRLLTHHGLACTYAYGSMDASARKISLGKFRAAKCPIMVVTDVAARGLDLPLLDNVINLHFPSKPKLFVHRVGRVARAGRSGTAYSLLEPAELPYLFELRLYLGKGLPKPPFTASDAQQQQSADQVVATIPSTLFESEVESCSRALRDEGWLASQEKTCVRAYKLYCRTRESACPATVAAAKQFSLHSMPVHSMFSSVYDAAAAQADALRLAVSAFKARTTIFDVGGRDHVMNSKRKLHQKIVENGDPVDSGGVAPKEDFRDARHFIGGAPGDAQASKPTLKELVLDLEGEDAEQVKKLRGIRRWDTKRKRFVRLGDVIDEKALAKRNESGVPIHGADAKINVYQKWAKKSRREIPAVGTMEESIGGGSAELKGLVGIAGGRFKHRLAQGKASTARAVAAGNNGAVDELKDVAQIRKQRIHKAKEQARLKRKKKSSAKR